MKNNFLKNLYNKKIYILSPHLDDAILSCGQLLEDLSGKAEIHIINVFTKAHKGPYTQSAKKYLSLCGYKDGVRLYSEREKEDKKACASLRVSLKNLDFQDGLFRKRTNNNIFEKLFPEINHLYPLFRFHVMRNKVTKYDVSQKELENILEATIPNDAIVFAPIAQSKHVDHFIVRNACDAVCNQVYYYAEFPYKNQVISEDSYTRFILPVNKKNKNGRIAFYHTQIAALFPSGSIPEHEEIYFEKRHKDMEVEIYDACTKQLEYAWETLWHQSESANLFNSVGWYKAYVEAFHPTNQKIICIYFQGRLQAVAPFIQEKHYGIAVFKTPGNHFSQRLDILLDWSDKSLVENFVKICRKIGIVQLNHCSQTEMNDLKNKKEIIEIASKKTLQFKLLKNDTGELLISKRGQILKKARDEEKFIHIIDYKKNMQDGLQIAFKIDAKSTKAKNNYNVFSSQDMRNFYRNVSKYLPEYLGITIMFYKNNPVAYEVGFIQKNIYIDSERAYLASSEYYTPGKVLLVKLAERLVKEDYALLDLGPGIDNFKQSLTTEGETFSDILIVNNLFIGKYILFANVMREKIYTFLFEHRKLYVTYRKIISFLKK